MADSLERSNSITRQPNNPTRPENTRRPYVCSRCSKRFQSTHALGGHQNAHKHERSEERRLQEEEKRLGLIRPQPDGMGSTNLVPLAMAYNNSSAPIHTHTHGGAMFVQPLVTGFVYGCPQAGHVFVPAGTPVVMGGAGGVPYMAPDHQHQQNLNHNLPYYYMNSAMSTIPMLSTDAAGPSDNTDDDHQDLINIEAEDEEELDLTLRL